MRYLYGDLTEFPLQENTLALLERFVDMAVEVLKLDRDIQDARKSIDEDRALLAEALGDIDDFRACVKESIESTVAGRPDDDIVSVLAGGLVHKVDSYVGEGRNKLVATVEQRIQKTEGEISAKSREVFTRLKTFFMDSGVPVSGNALRCKLEDGAYQATAEILDVTGVRCVYALNTSGSDLFSSPKRFGDVVPGKQEFPVGTRRARFKKEPVVESMRIDDALLSSVLDADDHGEFKLARAKGNGTDGLLVKIGKGPEQPMEIFRVETDGARYTVGEDILTSESRAVLRDFWKQVFPQVVALYRSRGDISFISIDGKDVVGEGLTHELIDRLVRLLAPTVREIDARSPAVEELTLKIEHEGGRREEIYIPKQRLVRRVAELPADLRSTFVPLGLSSSLPGRDGAEANEGDDEDVVFEEPPTEPDG